MNNFKKNINLSTWIGLVIVSFSMLLLVVIFMMPTGVQAQATLTNTGLAANSPSINGNLAAFTVIEFNQNSTDLNSDGDASDFVVHVYDSGTGMTTNLALSSFNPTVSGNLVVFSVDEYSHNNVDLNGDGDAFDRVVHVYDTTTGITTNLGLSSFSPTVSGNLVAFSVDESYQNNIDLNGDGDAFDRVVHVYDASTGITRNLGLDGSGGLTVSGNLVAFNVNELKQNNTDLNGDGDASDSVLHVYNASTDITTNLGLYGLGNPSVSGNLVAFSVLEYSQNYTDLNDDGDAFDRVIHVYDASTDIVTNLGLDGSGGLAVSGNLVAFIVKESSQNYSDLNGDGDTSDRVVHVYDASTDITTNLALDGSGGLAVSGDLAAFIVKETNQSFTDLNGDGDTSDLVVHVYDAGTDIVTNLGLDGSGGLAVSGNLVAFIVKETNQSFTDLNGDGDTSDRIVHVYDTSTGITANLGFDGSNLHISNNLVAFTANEFNQNNTDLNGDGDTSDRVVHIYNASASTMSESPALSVANYIHALISDGILQEKYGKKITKELNKIAKYLSKDKIGKACKKLEKLVAKIIKLLDKGKLSEEHGVSLLVMLTNLEDDLGCIAYLIEYDDEDDHENHKRKKKGKTFFIGDDDGHHHDKHKRKRGKRHE